MIVCICNNVNSDAIKSAIDNGADTLQSIKDSTKAATCCGKCEFKVAQVMSNHQPNLAYTVETQLPKVGDVA